MRIKDVIAFTLFAFYSNLLAVIIFFSHFFTDKIKQICQKQDPKMFWERSGTDVLLTPALKYSEVG